jgi:hydroxyacylglutathione hydrolase
MLKIVGLPAFDSNYLWVLHNDCNAWAVDPGDADVVGAYLAAQHLTLSGILITHHHADHVGGVVALKKAYPLVQVIGPMSERIQGLDIDAVDGADYALTGLDISVRCIATPGHTAGHVAFYLAPGAVVAHTPRLFCGDTLFAAGCGRLFEGTTQQLHDSLHRLMQLPDNTLAYCAHEYTASNLAFALAVEPQNTAIQSRSEHVKALRAAGTPTVPFVLGEELDSNVFLRSHQPEVIASASQQVGLPLEDSVDVFAALREWKNRF